MTIRAEDILQRQVANYLAVATPSLLWTHFPAGEARSAKTGAKLRSFGLKRGWPDLIFVLPSGRFAAIELKAPAGRQSPEQKAVQASIEAAGGLYVICRDLPGVVGILTVWGVVPRANVRA